MINNGNVRSQLYMDERWSTVHSLFGFILRTVSIGIRPNHSGAILF